MHAHVNDGSVQVSLFVATVSSSLCLMVINLYARCCYLFLIVFEPHGLPLLKLERGSPKGTSHVEGGHQNYHDGKRLNEGQVGLFSCWYLNKQSTMGGEGLTAKFGGLEIERRLVRCEELMIYRLVLLTHL
jgi:hypothetical protein